MTIQQHRVVVIFTGGTIASKLDVGFGGIVPTLSASEILSAVPGLRDIADIESIEFARLPGPHVTPSIMLELAELVKTTLARSEITGVVVTHGTDTLEETAFFLDCVIESNKPVVVVGSIRNSSEPDWDGPRNLRDAVSVAIHPSFKGAGTIVCLGGSVSAASEVTKTNTNDLETFESFDFGPLARISNGKVVVYRKPYHRSTYSLPQKSVVDHVPLLKCYAGMDGLLFRFLRDQGSRGLVVEAFGVGNVPPPVFAEIVEFINQGIPVVLVSRCPVGRTEHVYAYEGAGKHLYSAGVIFADFLNGQKARIKLMILLSLGYSTDQIRHEFEWVVE